MSDAAKSWALVERVNARLREQGDKITQRIERGGLVLVGYEPQPVFDAVNEIVGAGAWSHKIVGEPITSTLTTGGGATQVLALVEVEVTVAHPDLAAVIPAWGSSAQSHREPGDAINGAITRAIQKAFSRIGIGRDAFRGELADIMDGSHKSGAARAATEDKPRPAGAKPSDVLKKEKEHKPHKPHPLDGDGVPRCEGCGSELSIFKSRNGVEWAKCPNRKSVKGADGKFHDADDAKEHDFMEADAARDRAARIGKSETAASERVTLPPREEPPPISDDDLPFDDRERDTEIEEPDDAREAGKCKCGLDMVRITDDDGYGYAACIKIARTLKWTRGAGGNLYAAFEDATQKLTHPIRRL
jgi:hypothetical protein